MNPFGTLAVALSLVANVGCSDLTTLKPTDQSSALILAPSLVPAEVAVLAASVTVPVPVVSAPVAPVSGGVSTSGTVGPLSQEAEACFAGRYPCDTFDFSLVQAGPIEVTLTWDGPPRAVLVQLYWADEGLAHEDVAPREGPSQIRFRRPLMEAADYRLRVVSLEPGSAIPFTLTLVH